MALAFTRAAEAQTGSSIGFVRLGGTVENRYRLEQILGASAAETYLLRSTSRLLRDVAPLQAGEQSVQWLSPEVLITWNSSLPFSFNDGVLWAGRGLNLLTTGGLRQRFGPLTLIIAPELYYQANLPFQVIEYSRPGEPRRSRFAHPYHPPPESIDWPIRFGADRHLALGPGQTSLSGAWGPVEVGIGSENVWWGPGIRNALVLGSQGPGFLHAWLGSAVPHSTPVGAVSWIWLVGRLDESDYFDSEASNDHRSISAAGLTLQMPFDPGLTLGAARVVFSALRPDQSWLGGAFDFLDSVGQPNSLPPDSVVAPGADQIFSMFGRWVIPASGFEVYAEWARFEEPESLRDFLEFPQHSQGYTIGFQWARRASESALLRLHAEATNLEPSSTWRHRRVFSTYTSRTVPQGYTHRGQPLGAGIGPGASSQWLSIDHERIGAWRLGVFAGRIRWDAAPLYTDVVPEPRREDVSLFWGLRGSAPLLGWQVAAELTHGVRLNYLFQSFRADPMTGKGEGVDVANTTLSVALTRNSGSAR